MVHELRKVGTRMSLRAAAAILIPLLLAACASEAPIETPAMYVDIATPGARLDPVAAASMISQYRGNNGLPAVAVDAELMRLAEAQSQAMAAQNKLDHDVRAPLAKRFAGAGYAAYLQQIERIYADIRQLLKPEARVVLEVANLKDEHGITTLAWDVARAISNVLVFEGEVVIGWDSYGYGYDHSYCLVFRNPAGEG